MNDMFSFSLSPTRKKAHFSIASSRCSSIHRSVRNISRFLLCIIMLLQQWNKAQRRTMQIIDIKMINAMGLLSCFQCQNILLIPSIMRSKKIISNRIVSITKIIIKIEISFVTFNTADIN